MLQHFAISNDLAIVISLSRDVSRRNEYADTLSSCRSCGGPFALEQV